MATISKTARYFRQVASVIGNEQAYIELQKVIDSNCGFSKSSKDFDITSAFQFHKSPQGFAFWSDISDACGAWIWSQ